MNMQQMIKKFKTNNFDEASLDFFKYLNVPLNRLIEESININDLLEENKAFDIVDTTYMIGGIDDNIFQGKEIQIELKPQRYEGLLVFAINLNITNPTRAQLSTISRIFNRKFEYTPVVILFKYDDKLSLSNTQRQKYSKNQKWRDGEKIGKVSILRDIEIDNPHRGHIDILEKMKLSSKINNYEELYSYWQEVFDVSILNKLFYKELSNWYFWTLKNNNVSFPNAPKGLEENADTLRHEHNAKNVIRLLTRLLFVWFMKEKGLIPNKLFEEEYIKDNLLKEFEPKKADGLFKDSDRASKYYKAVLQNLFFATLNQEMGKRAFRLQNSRGQHQNITNLMRYEKYFTNPSTFIDLVEKIVPFMNGGLFECLDKPHPTLKGRQGGAKIIYEDGFSDREDNELIVPDYVFFGLEEHVDLSSEYGTKGKANKDTKIKGLINILNSYKFTVAENTPIEEDVALDPELLGKVFENLLASYNPETKTTARKQTGSFYTPREIVSYMVDESLIAYLKTKLDIYEDKEELDNKLHKLLAYDEMQPFEDRETVLKIINAIDTVKILDPAVGSGAFPMGTLQKMVHLLHKLDPNNEHWQDLQKEKAQKETNEAFEQTNKSEIKQKIDEITDAFDEKINHPDYARKLYLIENSIFGVDIQPIAIQISKLRFFISLVVEQNVNNGKPNFGIRPLPNLESKFVTANTLIGIDKAENNLFDNSDIKKLEKELKAIRHKIFNAKTPKTKNRLREQDKELREQISLKLIENGLGNDTAKQLASWNPYDQNASSPFFDMEWMFGIEDGFDIVIGNPPYGAKIDKKLLTIIKKTILNTNNSNSASLFIDICKNKLSNKTAILSLIVPKSLLYSSSWHSLVKAMIDNTNIIVDVEKAFDNVKLEQVVIIYANNKNTSNYNAKKFLNDIFINDVLIDNKYVLKLEAWICDIKIQELNILEKIQNIIFMKEISTTRRGIGLQKFIKDFAENPIIGGKNLSKFKTNGIKGYLSKNDLNSNQKKLVFMQQKKIMSQDLIAHIQNPKPHIKIISSYDSVGDVFSVDTVQNTILHDESYSYKYILSLLNSKFISWYAYKFIFCSAIRTMHFDNYYIGKIPIKVISKQDQQPFINIVDKIIEQKANDEDTIDLETQLDAMVYKLYGLSDDEIDIVEGR